MISITISLGPGSRIKGFVVTGHANFSEYGKDIVCAAVSAIAQTALIGLQQYFGTAVQFQQTPGKLSCTVPDLEPKEYAIAEAILKTMYWGLRNIETQYSKHIRLIIEGGVWE